MSWYMTKDDKFVISLYCCDEPMLAPWEVNKP